MERDTRRCGTGPAVASSPDSTGTGAETLSSSLPESVVDVSEDLSEHVAQRDIDSRHVRRICHLSRNLVQPTLSDADQVAQWRHTLHASLGCDAHSSG